MKIFIGGDHRGFELKETLKTWLQSEGHDVIDCGNSIYDNNDDFPDFSFAVGDRVIADAESRGVVICGSAGGVMIAANKIKGVRCVTGVNSLDVKHNRENNDANVLALASDFMTPDQAKELIDVFLKTAFLGQERMVRRLKKIGERER